MLCWHRCEDGRAGLRRWIKVPVRKGVGSNPTSHNNFFDLFLFLQCMRGVVTGLREAIEGD
jgi:hypothetical protein